MRYLIVSFISICLASGLSQYKVNHSFISENSDEIEHTQPDAYDDAVSHTKIWDEEEEVEVEDEEEEEYWKTEPNNLENEYSFLVKIYGQTTCTGVRYKDDIILTTASCAQNNEKGYTVEFFDNVEPTDIASAYNVLRVIPHPKYAVDPRAYDIGIIQISVNETRPQYNYVDLTSDHSVSQPGAILKALIWGVDSYANEHPKLTSEIYSLLINVFNTTECGDLVSQLHPLLEFCGGNSRIYGGLNKYLIGSPVLIQNENVTTVVGLFAQTDDNYGGSKPGEFTRLSEFRYWIVKTIKALH